MSMRVLVTGGAGYIGSQTAKALAQAGHEPVVYDNLSTGHRWAVKWGASVEGDLADTALLSTTLRTHRVEAVLHFAAHIEVGESVENPRKYFWNNVVNTLRLLDAALGEGVGVIVFSSSAAVYGVPEKAPIPEDHPTRPTSPYGETKLMMERALEWYGIAYGLRWVALRYFNAAGADLDGELGEEHHPESHLIPRIIQAAQGRLPQVEVYGSDYPTPDGTAIRDYIHIVDLAEAHVRALEYLCRGGESGPLNLGTGKGHSVREVIASVGRMSAGPVPWRDAPRRPGDPPILVADPTRAMEVLGWKPQHPDLDSIVESAWRWHKKNSE
ncbi:MAG: UDP-glucose 4-epimerase GalE [Acidobacteriia bacterium]|nr:UDP-glucose 4-epimerase GalE [Terriglobia bacterium]